jgi:hypothetical protein
VVAATYRQRLTGNLPPSARRERAVLGEGDNVQAAENGGFSAGTAAAPFRRPLPGIDHR